MKNDKYQTLIQPRLGEIAAYLNAGNPPAKAAELLMEAAMNAGAHDNVSIVVLLDKEGAK